MRGTDRTRFAFAHRALVAGAVFALTRPCGAQVPLTQRDSIQAQVQAALDSLTDAWRPMDVDGMMRFYLDSALIAENSRLRTARADRAAIERRRPGVLGQRIGPFRPIRFDVLSRDVVVVSWVNTFAVIDTGGRARPTMVAANTYVWVRRGGAWRILTAHESTRTAPDSMALSPPDTQGADSDRLDGLARRSSGRSRAAGTM